MKERKDREKLKKKYLELEERFRRKTMNNLSQVRHIMLLFFCYLQY